HAGGYARRMPIHSHHGAKRLEPEGMRQPSQEFIAAIVVDDCLADHGAERGHPRRKPWRHMSAMQRKLSTAGALAHGVRMIRRLHFTDWPTQTTPRHGSCVRLAPRRQCAPASQVSCREGSVALPSLVSAASPSWHAVLYDPGQLRAPSMAKGSLQ